MNVHEGTSKVKVNKKDSHSDSSQHILTGHHQSHNYKKSESLVKLNRKQRQKKLTSVGQIRNEMWMTLFMLF